ncbi:iron ABC transporter permease [Paenibacillus tarimensis]|nr:iron ABC transporter permease [Paenibacillus tarimensis]MCF2944169.1 iron ABC transporter permease [Paenibacillus tarimensis]
MKKNLHILHTGQPQTQGATVKGRPAAGWIMGISGIVLLALISLLHIMQGEAGLTAERVLQAILQPSGEKEDHIVWTARLPRTAIGFLAGGSLAVAGILLQALTRNPLASASTFGINAGAYFAVVAASVAAPALASSLSLPLALLGGGGAGLFAYLLAGGSRSTPVRMALSGMIVSLTLAAVTSALLLLFENETRGLYLWGSGSLVQLGWGGFLYAWPWIAGGSAAAWFMAKNLDAMALGDEMAQSLGQHVTRVRTAGLLLAVLLAAITVSVVGPIGFIGLIAPHLLRLVGIVRHRLLIPTAFLWGAVIVLGADMFAMMFRSSIGQLPVGAVTALIGAPWLIWLAGRVSRGKGSDVPKSSSQSTGAHLRHVPYLGWAAGLAVVLAALMIGGQAFGGIRLPLQEVVSALFGSSGGSEMSSSLVMKLRLPRTLIAALAGAALALSGLLLQSVVRNPLADPSIIGVTQGAGVGVLTLLVFYPGLGGYYLSAAACAGAVLTAGLVYLLSVRSGLQPAVLALIGMAVSAMGAAIINILVIKSGMSAAAGLAWLAGSTYAKGWPQLPQLGVVLLILVPLALWQAKRMDMIQFTDESSSGLGVNPARSRLIIGILGVLLAAAAVATVGTVGFIGLIAPHAVRLMAGPTHRKLVPLTLLFGALLLVLADFVGRAVLAPVEIPSGLVAALLGAPYFVWLMYASSRSTKRS